MENAGALQCMQGPQHAREWPEIDGSAFSSSRAQQRGTLPCAASGRNHQPPPPQIVSGSLHDQPTWHSTHSV